MCSVPFIHRLPPELLSHIFIFCIDLAHHFGGISYVPITLGLVCKNWRELTLQTHALWTTVRIGDRYPYSSYSRAIAYHIPALTRWVARSGDLSCHVQIIIQPTEEPTALPAILHPITHRLRHLDLSLPFRDLQRLTDLFTREFPRLKCLLLSSSDYCDDEEHPCFGLSLSTCQRLHTFELSMVFEVCIDVTRITTSLPSSLAHLVLEAMDSTTVFHVLSQLPNLKSFTLDCQTLSERNLQVAENTNSASIDISLTSLTIFFEKVDFSALFRTFRFPYLTDLWLTNLTDAQGILPAITSSSPPLKTLHLGRITTNSDELLRCFENLPTITSLSLIDCSCLDNTLIMALTFIPDRQHPYLPRLEYLSIRDEFREGHAATHEEVVDMVASRWHVSIGNCSRIVKIYLMQNSVMNSSQIQRMVQMEEEGLDIVMQWIE